MKINGTLINYYFHCKRQCYLCGNRLNLEDNSELVIIGKALHETKYDEENSEISIESIKVDKIKGKYLIEYKKSNSDIEACKWQLYYYLYVLKNKGIDKVGKLICFEKKTNDSKSMIIELDDEIIGNLIEIEKKILALINSDDMPSVINSSKCKKCAYYTYCYI
ncbi:MAG: CRISPR-associated protein Cas4 [Firmicutes bacterium]|jgi:CRISPR-associated exonuclease Cas4|nr:CRISPR-associated protein Cas4 [Bacillota bacterium]